MELQVSEMAEHLIGSEIIKLAGEIKARMATGEKIYDLTIGDFNPKIFPIPTELKEEIIKAYQNDETNYPPANGIESLRKAVSGFIDEYQGLDYKADEILISGGARPLIYAIYQALLDPNDKVVFPVPSWNNNHYTHLSRSQKIMIETKAENNFMPSAEELKAVISDATLVALCSPLNPTGTVFSKAQLASICEMILAENKRREGTGDKPLYLMYDQIYNLLTFGNTVHHDPVKLYPEMKQFTIFVDGISKSLAATGVRVGWAFGPAKVIDKMKSILGHVGAWSPKAEQVATAAYLQNSANVKSYLTHFKSEVEYRLNAIYNGIQDLKAKGYIVDIIAPQAAIYLSVQFNLIGKTTQDGTTLNSTRDISAYLLNDAKLAIVPFYAFGTDETSTWYRISIGTLKREDIPAMFEHLEASLNKLS